MPADAAVSPLSPAQHSGHTSGKREVVKLKQFFAQRDISTAAVCLENLRVAHTGKAHLFGDTKSAGSPRDIAHPTQGL